MLKDLDVIPNNFFPPNISTSRGKFSYMKFAKNEENMQAENHLGIFWKFPEECVLLSWFSHILVFPRNFMSLFEKQFDKKVKN